MSKLTTFQQILDLLDHGLAIYRRGFLSFMSISSLAIVPTSIVLILGFGAVALYNLDIMVLFILLVLPFGVVLLFIGAGAISRIAVAMQHAETMSIGQALHFAPRQVASLSCWGSVVYVGANMLTSLLTCLCFLPAFFGVFFSFAAWFNAPFLTDFIGVLAIFSFIFITLTFYAVVLILNGTCYGFSLFAIQAMLDESLRFGPAVQRSSDLIFYRIGSHLLFQFVISLCFTSLTLIVTFTAASLIPLPAVWLIGPESPITVTLSGAAWLIGAIIALPVLPIWNALLYQRRHHERYGEDLAERIAMLSPALTPPPSALPTERSLSL